MAKIGIIVTNISQITWQLLASGRRSSSPGHRSRRPTCHWCPPSHSSVNHGDDDHGDNFDEYCGDADDEDNVDDDDDDDDDDDNDDDNDVKGDNADDTGGDQRH